MAREEVYVSMMVDTLERKKIILEKLLHQTREQETLLKDEEMDVETFQNIIDQKGEEIEKLNQMDEGFDTLFRHVEKEITANRMTYKKQILQMQNLINEYLNWASRYRHWNIRIVDTLKFILPIKNSR